MIGVTGASGKLGRLVVSGLLEKKPSEQIAAIVRDPEKVSDFASRGVLVRKGDYSAPESLVPALTGIDRLLLISSNALAGREGQHKAVIDAAKTAGVKRIAYTSVLKANTISVNFLKVHGITEVSLKESGIPFTILRNGWYIENYTDNLAMSLSTGAIFGTAGDGAVSAASRSDYAAAAVAVLTKEGHAGKTYELAGDETFTMSDLARAVSDWAGKPIVYNDLPPEAYKKSLLDNGLPEVFATFVVEAGQSIGRGELMSNSKDLHTLIGRDTATLRSVLASLPKP